MNQEGSGERLTAPFVRFVKQEPLRQWFSDALNQGVGGYHLERLLVEIKTVRRREEPDSEE